jgi:2-isopropylmalate synthase
LEGEALDRVFQRFKELCDNKKEVSDEDIIALIDTEALKGPETYQFSYLNVSTGTNIIATATIGVTIDGVLHEKAAVAKGPIDATFAAINSVVEQEFKLEEFKINAVTSGRDAQGEVVVKVSYQGRTFTGRGLSVNIIESSARAYLNAINRAINMTKVYSNNNKNKAEGM